MARSCSKGGRIRRWFELAVVPLLVLAVMPFGATADESGDEVGFQDQHSLYYGVHLPRERVLARGLTIAKQLLEEQRYAESLPVLVRVLHSTEDAYPAGPSPESDEQLSLKSEAARIVARLPAEGQRAYRLEVQAQAERELSQAARSGPDALRLVVSRFPHTEASRLASWLLAQHAFEFGEFREAIVCLETLKWDGMPRDQRDQVDAQIELARQAAGDSAAKSTVEWNGEGSRLSGSREWLAAGGGPARNPLLDSPSPHLWAAWVSSAAGLPGWAASASVGQDDSPRASAVSPLVVGRWVVVRRHDGLAGVDRESGKLVWRRRLPSHDSDTPASHQIRRMQGDAAYLKDVLESESRDAVSTRISSDGRLVFAVAAWAGAGDSRPRDAWRAYSGGAFAIDGGQQNQLVAVDALAEGKLRWRSSDVDGLDGVFFLDCPLVVGDRLFVLGEQDQAVCLLQLDPQTGEVRWRQTIATVESPVQQEAMRRMVGGSACYADGLVVCSTGAGLLAAVDPLQRTLRWVYRFPVEGGVQLGRSTPWGRRGSDRWPRDARRQWLWNQMLVADGKVLVGSPESRRLHCVDLQSGEADWSTGNSNPQLLCSADNGVVIVAREDAVAGVALDDGRTTWTTRLPTGAHPAGVGAWFRGGCLLPLSDGSAVLLRPEDGEIASTWRVGPEGVMGNLAFDGQSVYSQSFTGVARFNTNSTEEGSLRREAEIASVNGRDRDVLTGLIEGYRESGVGSEYAARLREVLARSGYTDVLDAAQPSELVPLFTDRPTPVSLRLARLDAAVKAADAAAVRREVAEFLNTPVGDQLLTLDASRAVAPALWFRAAVEATLDRDARDILRNELSGDAGPDRMALLNAVFGRAGLVDASQDAQRFTPDGRWVLSQVRSETRPRADRVRRRSGGRVSSNPSEFELPLLVAVGGARGPVSRLVASSSGQVSLMNALGEVTSQIELPRSSPERLQRLASEDAPVAGCWGRWLCVCTGDDVIAIDTASPDSGAVWSAKRSLLEVDAQGPPGQAARLRSVVQAAAQREVRLVGVAEGGVTVAARDLVACLDPVGGYVLWVVSGIETEGRPTADAKYVYSSPTLRPGWRLDLADGRRAELATPSGDQLAILGGRVAVLQRDSQSARLIVVDRSTGGTLLDQQYEAAVQHCYRGPLLTMVDRVGVDVFDLSAPEGVQRLLHDDLSLEADVVSVVAERVDNRLLVGVNHAAPHVHRAARIMPIDQNPVQSGPLFCYSLADGGRLWPSPVQVSGKALLARQPQLSPLALLAASVQERDSTGRYDSVQLVAVDLASGRTVHRDSGPRNDRGRQYRIQLGQGPKPYYQISLDDHSVVLSAEPHPTPPGPPARAPVEQSEGGSLWDMGRAINKLLGEGLGEIATPEPEDDD